MTDFLSDVRAIAEKGVPDGSEPVTVVDIGSNSIRLVIYEGLTRAPNILFNEKIQAGLGISVAETGELSPEALDRAFAALRRFKFLSNQAGAKKLFALATAAAREAKNGDHFIATANEILGTEIRLLSGKEEAHFAAMGVRAAFHKPNGVVGDMGGGSLELLQIKKNDFGHGITLPLGGLRLSHDAKGDPDKAAKIAKKSLKDVKAIEKGQGKDFFAVGGTWRNIAKLYMAETDYPLHIIHDFRMSQKDVLKFCDRLQTKPLDELRGIDDVSTSRRALLPIGAAVLASVVKAMDASSVRFSAYGVREGVLSSFLEADLLLHDPLVTAAVLFAVLRSRSADHAVELCNWTDQAFELFNKVNDSDQARLRWAACLLADIAWRAHPDYRGRQSMNIISHGDFVGLDHAGRAFLAVTAYYRNEGLSDNSFSTSLLALCTKEQVEEARLLAALLRLATLFTASMPTILKELRFTGDSSSGYQLMLPRGLADLNGERPQRRAKRVGQLLDADLTIDTV